MLQCSTVTRYDADREYYWIDYENGDSEEMTHRVVTKYKCIEPDIVRRSSERIRQQQANATTSQHFAYAVYDEETGKMMELRELRKHPNPTIRKERDQSSANEYR